MNNFNCIYPNPFRDRKVKKALNCEKILKETYQSIKFFLEDDLSLIHQQIDEFGNPKLEKRFKKIFKTKMAEASSSVKEKVFFFFKPIKNKFLSFNNLNNYYDNLRYLDLPVQPLVDKHGFEIQVLSNELVEEVLEEIDDDLSLIYNYLPNTLPDPIEDWYNYALGYPDQFPHICHDAFLEYDYELIDRVFANIRKNSKALLNSVITGDLDTCMLKITTPNFNKVNGKYIVMCIKSMGCLILLLLIIKFMVVDYLSKVDLSHKKYIIDDMQENVRIIRSDFLLNKLKFQQKSRKLKAKLFSLKINSKYAIAKFILSTNNITK